MLLDEKDVLIREVLSLTSAFVLCSQAVVYCTCGRARKVVVGLAILSLIIQVIRYVTTSAFTPRAASINAAVFLILPLAILVINMIVLCAVRRASNIAAATLGRHQQSTSSNSAIPTIMLVTTSIVYVLLCSTWSFLHIMATWFPASGLLMPHTAYQISEIMQRLIFVYNSFVYLITGKQFRSELCSSFCCGVLACAAAADHDDAAMDTRQDHQVTSSV